MPIIIRKKFLYQNWRRVKPSSSQEENYAQFYALAAGNLTEEALADWLESKMVARD